MEDVPLAMRNSSEVQETKNVKLLKTITTSESGNGPIIVVISLGCIALILIMSAIALYLYRKKERKKRLALVRSKKKKYRPNLSLNLPDSMMLDIRTEKQVKIQSGPDVHVVPATPATPMTPAEFTPDFLPQARMHRSVSVPAEAHAVGRGKDELWRVVKNSNRQFLSTKPKADRKISYCVNGKIKFSLKYDLLGQKELLVEVSEIVD